jgi:NADH-quinone oxidoreductase subunit L
MSQMLYLIPLFPLLGFLANGLLGRWLSDRQSGLIASLAVFGSFMISTQLLLAVMGGAGGEIIFHQSLFTWIQVGAVNIDAGYTFDALTGIMTLVVTGVGLLIHIYSIGYMHNDPGIARYFAFLNLFTFMMLNLVLANNLVLLFLGWEGVGLCSYLLIGFWFDDEAKARAGMKAFIANRIGDAGFIIGMIILFRAFGTLNMHELAEMAPGSELSLTILPIATLLLFVGATGKSAQIPLFVWLPDAMAGPTPVSALIHAATMVTAGVYLVARNSVLFALAPTTMSIIAGVGALTAFFAATIALAQNDIKKVLAYSTISQLGYMFMAVGVGAFSAGIFHLMTHAFFKALLFLGAGSVIHGMGGEQDMRKMGGLKDAMPATHFTMIIGVLAIAGVPGLAGFFSKDEILWGAFTNAQGFSWIWLIGVVTAGLTAFYMFRLLFKTFYSKSRWEEGVHPHESPSVMTLPLMLLAFLSIFGGYVGVPEVLGGGNMLHHFLQSALGGEAFIASSVGEYGHSLELILMAISVAVGFVGIYYAYRLFVSHPGTSTDIKNRLAALHRLTLNKYYVDEVYAAVIVNPVKSFADILWRWVDTKFIDAAVNGSGRLVMQLSDLIRFVQSGLIQHYASFILAGVIFIMLYIYLN